MTVSTKERWSVGEVEEKKHFIEIEDDSDDKDVRKIPIITKSLELCYQCNDGSKDSWMVVRRGNRYKVDYGTKVVPKASYGFDRSYDGYRTVRSSEKTMHVKELVGFLTSRFDKKFAVEILEKLQ